MADLRQDRRQWLKTTASALGASLVAVPPAAGQAPAGEEQAGKRAPEGRPGPFLTPAQHRLLEELSETIIPADGHSGGGKAAKVADYVDQVLRETYDDSQRTLWREGLRLIDVMSLHYHGKTFVEASPEDRIAVLTVLSEHTQMTDLPEVRFFNELKRMTVKGYYTSKIGIHDELEYKGNRILKEYVGCDDPAPSS